MRQLLSRDDIQDVHKRLKVLITQEGQIKIHEIWGTINKFSETMQNTCATIGQSDMKVAHYYVLLSLA